MISKYKPNENVIITRTDDNLDNPNCVFVKSVDIDDITVKCLISYIKSKYINTSYYIINKTTENSFLIKFLYQKAECREYINLDHIFLYNNILFIFKYSLEKDFSNFQLMKNRVQKIKKIL